MLESLKQEVCKANIELYNQKTVIYTWGNVSAIDDDTNLIVIKPSGIPYEEVTADDMVVVNLQGDVVEGKLKPSSDTPTHIEIYKKFKSKIKSITHTHSTYATAFAEAGIDIKILGTTHADYFCGNIPVTRCLTEDEVSFEYEKNTGKVINETIINPEAIPAVLVRSHGVFTFGLNADTSVKNAVILEEIAKMNFIAQQLNHDIETVPEYIKNKHYDRKCGVNKYYGQ